MMEYKKKILNALIDSYERSKLFMGKNAIKQTIWKKPTDIEGKYTDVSEYKLFQAFNNSVEELSEKGFVICKVQKNGEISRIDLVEEKISDIYSFIKRTPKVETNAKLTMLLQKYLGLNPVLDTYCNEQLENLSKNKKVKYFDDDYKAFEDTLIAVNEIFKVEAETFERDFSIRVFGDSKRFGSVKTKVKSLLVNYYDVPEPETVFEDLNILKNPGHIYFKGNGKLVVNGEEINFSKFSYDIAISSAMLSEISDVKVHGSKVISIENLTTFNNFSDPDAFIIYLGGFHNTARRQFIKKLYEYNQDKQYFHYGDIDAGGFYILQHLRNKTGVPFKPYRMDVSTIEEHKESTKPLTSNDITRLNNLVNGEFCEVVEYMLKNNCKLEQEACD